MDGRNRKLHILDIAATIVLLMVGIFSPAVAADSGTVGMSVTVDPEPPASITDLVATPGTLVGDIDLAWTTPGDDGWATQLTGWPYTVKYDTRSVAELGGTTTTWWEQAAYTYGQGWAALAPGVWDDTHWLADLTPGTTYYIAIRATDDAGNEALDNNVASAMPREDVTAPAAITDLTGQCDSGTGDVTLYWSTPGDDGWSNTLPEGSGYRIDYSTYSKQWNKDDYEVWIPTNGVAPHTEVSHTITGLTGDTTWYFQIWTRDEFPNWSGLSNGATVWVNPILSVSISTNTYNFGEVPLSQSTHTVSVITVTNDGNINETYSLKISSVTLYDDSPSLWKSTDTTTGHNRFIFYAIFHGTDVASGYFELTDAVVDENRSSTSERYTYEDGSPPYKQTGVGVPADEERKIWFRLDMPTSTTTGKEEKIRVTVTAGPE